jgi:hypothetical protein
MHNYVTTFIYCHSFIFSVLRTSLLITLVSCINKLIWSWLLVYNSPSLVLMMSTGPPAQDGSNFVQTSKVFSFYLELHAYKNKFKNLMWASKFKGSFRGTAPLIWLPLLLWKSFLIRGVASLEGGQFTSTLISHDQCIWNVAW